MLGIEALKSLILSHPERVWKSLDILLENTITEMEYLDNADALFYAIVQAGILQEQLGNYKEIFEKIDGIPLREKTNKTTVVHLHGEKLPAFLFQDLPETCIIHYEQDGSIPYKPNHGPGLSEKQLGNSAQKKPFPFLTAGCVLPNDFPEETIRQWTAKN
jgi:hypothetical protein